MQAKIFAIGVLTFLEILYGVRIGLAYHTIKTSKDGKKVAKAQYNKEFYDWIFAIVMLVKFMIETDIIKVIPVQLWIADMLITNFCVIQLVIKYFKLRKS